MTHCQRKVPKSGNRFSAFAKSASAGEGRSEKTLRNVNAADRFDGLTSRPGLR